MMAHATPVPSLPSKEEATLAKETSRVLAARLRKNRPMRLRILDGAPGEATLELSGFAARLLLYILEETASGNAVTVVPIHAELTTQKAADLLNISRPSLIQLLDDGKIAFRRVGTHRRVPFAAVMKYKREADARRTAALDALAAYDQEIGL